MSNSFFNASGTPATRAPGVSLNIRNEFAAVAAGFDLLPTLTGNGLKLFRINSGGTAVEAVDGSTLYLPLSGGTLTGALIGTSATFSSTLTANSNLVVNGNANLGNASGDTVTIAGSAITWSGNPTHSGAHTFSSTVGITGALSGSSASFSSTLGVTGALTGAAATFSSTVGITGALSGSSATFSSTLGVSGALTGAAATFSGTLTANGALVANGNTTLGNASGDTLTVASSAVTWSGDPTHSGAHTFSSTVGITGALSGSSASFTGNVGVGVSPTYRLHVDNGGTTGSKLFKFGGSGIASLFGYSDAGGSGVTNSDPYSSGAMFYLSGTEAQVYTNGGKRIVVTGDGLLYGTALHNNIGEVTGTANQYICSGAVASATATAVTNVSVVSSMEQKWIRVGNVVHCSGQVGISPTAASAVTRVAIALPIASSFSNVTDGTGTAFTRDASSGWMGGAVSADSVSDVAEIEFYCTATGLKVWAYTFTYEVK